jgi:hypothetical protein
VPVTGGSCRAAKAVQLAVALGLVAGLLFTGGSGAILGDSSSAPDRSPVDPRAAAVPFPTTADPGSERSGSHGSGSAPGSASGGPPAAVTGGAGTPADQLAADMVTGVEQFWRDQFPAHFGRAWVNIRGFHAVDPGNPDVPAPCLRRPLDLSEQALYCARQDTVAWDRAGLLPTLRRTYGDGAVLVALAHEIGHAVQDRLGINTEVQPREPARYPTILLEAMADCFAGVVVHAAADGRLEKIRISRLELDRAVRALLSFRDPVGVAVSTTAHGDAFDRASAFLDGYQHDAGTCGAMTVRNQVFTQRGYTSLTDVMQSGDLPLNDLLAGLGPDVNGWFGHLVTTRGRTWQAPLRSLPALRGCATPNLERQGPVRYCASTGAVSMSVPELARVHDGLGDYAGGELLASRSALAALAALGRPVHGPEAGRTAVCLSGAYTRSLFDRSGNGGFGLSPGDIDEAVQELLDHDFAARDAAGRAPEGDLGFERITQFRAGALGGPGECGL